MRIKILTAVLAVFAFTSMPAHAGEGTLAAGISLSGANSSGMVSKMNGGVLLDGEYAGDKFTFFGSLGGVQLAKISLGDTQQVDAKSGVAYHFTENFEAGVGFRYSLMHFTEAEINRIDTAPFIVANYRFSQNRRLMTELHAPDSSQYETRAIAAALEQTFGRHKNYRFRAKFDYAEFDYNKPRASTSASQQGLVANTNSATAPEGFERKTLGSVGYAVYFSYLFNGKK